MRVRQRDPQTYQIIGVEMTVHKELGSGFLEAVYQEATSIEFEINGVFYRQEVEIPIYYRSQRLSKTYRADFVCFDNIIVELKALPKITGKEKAQVINYLKATGYERGLLINFGAESLQYERLVNKWK